MEPNVYLYILVMALVTYAIRVLPLTLIRKQFVEELGKVTNIDFSRRFMTLGEIKNIISDVKK